MIDILGLKRIIVLTILLVLNGVFGGAAFGLISPQMLKLDREIKTAKSKLSEVRNDLQSIQVEFNQLEDQQKEFSSLKDKRFFLQKERGKANELFLAIQEKAGVEAQVNVDKPIVLENKNAEKADYILIKNDVTVNATALSDVDIFRYIWEMENNIPGYLKVKSMILERSIDITRPVLQAISTGKRPEIINAVITAEWIFMVPKEEAPETAPDTTNKKGRK